MKTVKVRLGKRSYPIYIGKGATEKLFSHITSRIDNRPIFVVTNRKINTLHGRKLKKFLRPLTRRIRFYEVPDSEKAKSFSVYTKAISVLAHFARKIRPLVIAFGGGVVGDLAGFLASTYRRGVPYINIPTTLLAQVDSSIGGKVAIDIKGAKNIIGNFYQPSAVACDFRFLKTLPEKELRNGLVETLKYGIIKDVRLFSFIDKNLKKILSLDHASLEYIVYAASSIKARIVGRDEFDNKDLRVILNFGHTIGHAIEAASGYSRSVAHGRAVAYGMLAASLIALRMGILKKEDNDKINALIRKVLSPKIKGVRPKAILSALLYDKKFVRGVNKFILPKKIGRVKIVENIPQKLIEEVLREGVR
ncbi:MAG: 3-dehydroquinate synthase [Omnitrophica bacterium]|nr:3-dehydroquinate synthase [Candidatus Omnitrophota bacterium]